MTLCMSVICIFMTGNHSERPGCLMHSRECWTAAGTCSGSVQSCVLQGVQRLNHVPAAPAWEHGCRNPLLSLSKTAASSLTSLCGEQLRDGRCQAHLGICSGACKQGGEVWVGLSKSDTSPNHQQINKSQLYYFVCREFSNMPESNFGPLWLFFFFFVQLQNVCNSIVQDCL